VALAFCLLIQFVTSALDRSFVAKRTIEFQESQLAAVNQVAQRVRWQFQKLNDALHSLSQIPDVQFVQTNEALLHLIRAYRMNSEMVEGIFRLDRNGDLLLAYPEDAQTPSSDELRPILEHARLTGETVYQVIHRNWNGNDVMVIAKPVYTVQGEVQLHPNNKFAGLLLFAVSLHRLNRDILDLPTFGRGGFFWVITDEGVVVGAERGPLLGQQIAELSSRFPRRARDAFLRIVGRMRRGSSGNEVYSHPLGRYLPDFIVNEYSQSLPFAPLSRDVVMPETWQTRLVAFTLADAGAQSLVHRSSQPEGGRHLSHRQDSRRSLADQRSIRRDDGHRPDHRDHREDPRREIDGGRTHDPTASRQ
jgi:hypothetical protein